VRLWTIVRLLFWFRFFESGRSFGRKVRVQQFGCVKDFVLASASESLLSRSRAATGKACFDFDLGKIVPSRHQPSKQQEQKLRVVIEQILRTYKKVWQQQLIWIWEIFVRLLKVCRTFAIGCVKNLFCHRRSRQQQQQRGDFVLIWTIDN
jgi:hypothetical protein